MAKYIDCEKARELLKSNVHRFVVADEKGYNREVKYYEEVINTEVADKTLSTMPCVDITERKKGKWVKDSDGIPVCSVCGEEALQRLHTKLPTLVVDCRMTLSPFCPWCGADLREDKK